MTKKQMIVIGSMVVFVAIILCGVMFFQPVNREKNVVERIDEKKLEPVVDNNWLCVPGERVGLITNSTTEEDLKNIFGEKNITTEKKFEEEGTKEVIRTFVFKGEKNEIMLGWNEKNNIKKVDFVKIIGKEGTDWKTQEGITIGTSIDELNKLNGEPFEFYGFAWDFGGRIINWGNGKLAKQKGMEIFLRMEKQTEGSNRYLGDKKLKSDEPDLVNFGVKVAVFQIDFN